MFSHYSSFRLFYSCSHTQLAIKLADVFMLLEMFLFNKLLTNINLIFPFFWCEKKNKQTQKQINSTLEKQLLGGVTLSKSKVQQRRTKLPQRFNYVLSRYSLRRPVLPMATWQCWGTKQKSSGATSERGEIEIIRRKQKCVDTPGMLFSLLQLCNMMERVEVPKIATVVRIAF